MIDLISAPSVYTEVATKAELSVQRLLEDLEKKPALVNENDMLDRTYFYLGRVLTSLGIPMLRPRFLHEGELPFAEDHNDNMREATTDISVVFEAFQNIGHTGVNLHNLTDAEATRLNDVASQAEDGVLQLEGILYSPPAGYLTDDGEHYRYSQEDIASYIETFNTTDNIDLSQTSGTVDTARGVATLSRTSDENLGRDGLVDIVQDVWNSPADSPWSDLVPTGLPGNNLELSDSTTEFMPLNETPQIVLVAHTNKHNYLDSLIDADGNTWFEYERCGLWGNPQSMVKSGAAWIYSDGGSEKDVFEVIQPDDWAIQTRISQSNELVSLRGVGGIPSTGLGMGIIIRLPEIRTVTNIQLDPHIFPRARRHICHITSVQLLNDDGTSAGELIGSPIAVDRPVTITVPPSKAKAIFVRFVQSGEPYQTYLGHYFVEVTTLTTHTETESGLFGLWEDSETTTTYQTFRVKSVQEAYALNSTSGDADSILWGLWSDSEYTSVQVTNLTTGFDVFKGKRWGVAVEAIDVMQTKYQSRGDIVSVEYKFDKPLTAVKLVSWDTNTVDRNRRSVVAVPGTIKPEIDSGPTEPESDSPPLDPPEDAAEEDIGIPSQPGVWPDPPDPGIVNWREQFHNFDYLQPIGTEWPWSPNVGEEEPEAYEYTPGGNVSVIVPIAPGRLASSGALVGKTHVRYFLSVNGSSWMEVLPYGSGARRVRGALISDTLDLTTGAFAEQEIKRVRVKLSLERDVTEEDDAGYTPVVYGYQLVGVTIGDRL
jgi:hypothetical protein